MRNNILECDFCGKRVTRLLELKIVDEFESHSLHRPIHLKDICQDCTKALEEKRFRIGLVKND
jgi:hypothetical protein